MIYKKIKANTEQKYTVWNTYKCNNTQMKDIAKKPIVC